MVLVERSGLGSPAFLSLSSAALQYVLARRNPDGGYTFARGTDSNAQDTYYALAIFGVLNEVPPRIDETRLWLQSFPARDLRAHYYVTKGLNFCGSPPSPVALEVARQLSSPDRLDAVETNVEATSEFETLFMAVELLRTFSLEVDVDVTTRRLLGFLREDGSIGPRHSDLRSTHHAVITLDMLGYPVQSLSRTLDFIRKCENPRGGFVSRPGTRPPRIEDTYYGFRALAAMNESPGNAEETMSFVLACQNANGGFRASGELGISDFENTYRALIVLSTLAGGANL